MRREPLQILVATLVVLGLTEAGGQTASAPPSSAPAVRATSRPREDALTYVHAKARKARVGDVHYRLHFDLSEQSTTFAGTATLQFELRAAGEPLTLDFSGGSIIDVQVNGAPAELPNYGHFIELPDELLRAGTNQVRLRFRHPYSKDGTGLHRFVDPEDGRTYLYTYLWPYYANRVFPCFDQPNLKATFDLSVRVPGDWSAISMQAGRVTASDDSTSTWSFETTPKISTYVFSVHAGPYQVWEERAGDVPIRLFARRTLARYVAVDEWFDITRKGLAYYGKYFDIPYPFSKYDQLIVPDFAIGAMENVAAVTFAERFVQRKPSDRFERENRAGVVLHEMAHMWFGNLVTKNWWNGLWLNESFATLMAHFALVEATEFTDAWHEFYTDNKQRAYRRDSRVTTHPIEVPVPSTSDFFSVFDDITYQKGSSVLKQLAHFVGAEPFRRGVSRYLTKHAYGNTELEDFMDSLGEAAGRDLAPWAQQWLYEPGFNALQARVVCDTGTITRLVIDQTAPEEHPQLRSHRIDVALYGESSAGRLEVSEVVAIDVAGAQTAVAPALGQPCPKLVFPNHGDWSFARVILDAASVELIRSNLAGVDDPLSRSMFVQSLFDMARRGETSLEDYVELACSAAAAEDNVRVLAQLTRSVEDVVEILERLAPDSDAILKRVRPRITELAWEQAHRETNPDHVRLWFDLYVAAAYGEADLSRMRQLLRGDDTLPALPLSQDLRWQLVIALSAKGDAASAGLLAQERARDGSDMGQKRAIEADAAEPDPQAKARWLAVLLDPSQALGLAKLRAAMASLFPSTQTRLQQAQLETILSALPELSRTRDPYFLSSFVADLLKPMGREKSVTALARALQNAEALDSTTRRFLREAHQADQECLALRRGLQMTKR